MREKGTKETKKIAVILVIVTTLLFTACANPFQTDMIGKENVQQAGGESASEETGERVDTGFILTGPDSYDSADTPVVVDINRDDMTVTFLNLDINRRYTLSVDGTTKFYDKYGESISLNQIQTGDIVDVTFLK